ncbi:Uncharacterised protein [Klebsiella pneumoniae]|nr:Uncharacterised protein [Klebsiella pneumoniae]
MLMRLIVLLLCQRILSVEFLFICSAVFSFFLSPFLEVLIAFGTIQRLVGESQIFIMIGKVANTADINV